MDGWPVHMVSFKDPKSMACSILHSGDTPIAYSQIEALEAFVAQLKESYKNENFYTADDIA